MILEDLAGETIHEETCENQTGDCECKETLGDWLRRSSLFD